jgi:hypothetical protein
VLYVGKRSVENIDHAIWTYRNASIDSLVFAGVGCVAGAAFTLGSFFLLNVLGWRESVWQLLPVPIGAIIGGATPAISRYRRKDRYNARAIRTLLHEVQQE